MHCPLCHSPEYLSADATDTFLTCQHCGLVYRNPKLFLSPQQELERYQLHKNDIADVGYQEFVQPTVTAVMRDYQVQKNVGLDFGAGPGPVITDLLRKHGYSIHLYDPFFHPDKKALDTTYDFIVCCEVIEHFHQPNREFSLLKNLLNRGGRIYCQTLLYDHEIPMGQWHYSRDPTHVVFFTKKSLDYIQEQWEFNRVEVADRLVTFSL